MKVNIIEPKKIISWKDVQEIWQYRELLYFLAWRDFKVRYKQTVIGISWALVQPLVTMVIFSLFFARLNVRGDTSIPYPLFVYVGLLFWFLFSGSLINASESLITDKSIISKVYFPRIIIPFSSIGVRLVDLCIGILMLPFLCVVYRVGLHPVGLFVFSISILGTILISAGLGLFLAGLNVRYRDVKHILPFFIQIMLFTTPVFYSFSISPLLSKFSFLNPVGEFIEYTRLALFSEFGMIKILIPFSISCIIFVLGFLYFKKVERYFADII